MTTPAPNTLHQLRAGDKVDKYEVLAQVGAGGASTVWKGYDRLLDRAVAIKHLAFDPATATDAEAFLERFRNEVATAKKVGATNKGLIRLIDEVEDPRGLFLVLEFADGPTLAQLIHSQPEGLDPRQALGIIGATAMALGALHAQGVIHRDLKPANIILPRAGGLKVCDYGLSCLTAQGDGGGSGAGGSGGAGGGNGSASTEGTVHYMAPELFNEAPADPKTDIYALGMISYEMLAEKERFAREFRVVLRDTRNQAMRWLKWHTNLKAVATPLATLNPAVPKKLSDLVERMMEKDPAQRIASTDELLATIRRHFGAHSETEEQARKAEEARVAALAAAQAAEPTARVPKKKKWPLVAAVMVIFWSLVLGIGYMVYSHNQAQHLTEARSADLAKVSRTLESLKSTSALIRLNRPLNPDERVTLTREYSAAVATLEPVLTAWTRAKDESVAGPARAGSLYCQAIVKFAADDFEGAKKLLNEADALHIFDADAIHTDVAAITQRQTHNQMLAEIDGLINAAHFTDAREKLLPILDRKNVRNALSPEDLASFLALRAKIEDTERGAERAAILKAAREKYASGPENHRKAIDDLNAAANKDPFAAYKEQVAAWESQEDLDNDLARFEVAKQKGDLEEIVKLASRLQGKVSPEKAAELATEIKKAQSKLAYERGMKLREAQPQEARIEFEESDRLYPNKEAQDQLAAIKSSATKQDYIKRGDDRMTQNDFSGALDLYRSAEKLPPAGDTDLAKKIAKAQVAIAMAEVRHKFDARDVEGTSAAIKAAQDLNPGDPEAGELKSLDVKVKTLRDYNDSIARGDEKLFKDHNALEAKKYYTHAQTLGINDKEAKARLDEAEFLQLVAKIRQIMGNNPSDEDVIEADRIAKTLAGHAMTPEFKELLDQIDKRLKAMGK